jgi:hypothetical protein
MPPIPTVRPNKPLERGQTTIFSTLNSAISLQRPAPTRPGPVTKSTGQANTVSVLNGWISSNYHLIHIQSNKEVLNPDPIQ